MKKILVTGAAGFIGSKASELLLQKGQPVCGVDNLNDYYPRALKHHRLEQLKTHKKFEFIQADIENEADLNTLFKKYRFETVIHLAARAGVRASISDPYRYEKTNILGTLNLLECMRRYGSKKLVFASSSSVYAGTPAPFKETAAIHTPLSPYAATKLAGEHLCYTYHHLYGIDMSILRFFTVYGPAGRPDMSPFKFTRLIAEKKQIEIYGDGNQLRDFTYIDDIAAGVVLATKKLGYAVINLGGQRAQPLMTMVTLIEQHLGVKAKIIKKASVKADMKKTLADNLRARKLLSWKPKVKLSEGIARTVGWHKENHKWLQKINWQEK